MEVLHTAFIIKAKMDFENADLEDVSKRNTYAQKTPTTTLPFLETEYGNISESMSIETFLAKKFKPELLGANLFQKAKVNQWIEFGSCEIQNCLKEIIYPIFSWKEFWLNYLQALIHDEIDKLIKRKEKVITDKQRSVAVFSSSFTLIKNMLDYDLDFGFINQVLEEVCSQNKFKDTEKQDIVNFLIAENQQRPSAKNENKK